MAVASSGFGFVTYTLYYTTNAFQLLHSGAQFSFSKGILYGIFPEKKRITLFHQMDKQKTETL